MKKTILFALLAVVVAWTPLTITYAQTVPDYSGWTQEQRDAKLMELLTLVIQLMQQLAVLQAQQAAQIAAMTPVPQPVQPATSGSTPDPVQAPAPAASLAIGQFGAPYVIGGGCSSINIPVTLSTGGAIGVSGPEIAQVRQSPAVFIYSPRAQSTNSVLRFMASSTPDVTLSVEVGPSYFNRYLQDGLTRDEAAAKMSQAGIAFDPVTGNCL